MSRFNRRFFGVFALLAQVFCEFDNQNRVFGRLRNQQNEADLRIHVIDQSEHVQEYHRAQQSHRNRQQNGNGNHPAFVQGDQEQVSKQERQNQHDRRLTARRFFLQRHASPFVSIAFRQHLHGQFFHCVHRLCRTVSRRRRTVDFDRQRVVIARQGLRSQNRFDGQQRTHRHHFAFVVAHEQTADIVLVAAGIFPPLHVDFVNASVQRKVVDVRISQRRLQLRKDVFDVNTQNLRLDAVKVDVQLRRRRIERTVDHGHFRIFVRRHQQFVHHLFHLLRRFAARVLQTVVKAVRHADAGNGGQVERANQRTLNSVEFRLQHIQNRSNLHSRVAAHFIRFQTDNHHAEVRTVAADHAVSRNRHDV